MALLSLGRNVAIANALPKPEVHGQTVDELQKDASSKFDETRKGLLDTLNPWIPGDFVITYGLLLTAVPAIRGSFLWLLIIALVSAVAFIVLGAFAATGFRRVQDRTAKVRRQLLYRTIAGFLISVYAAVAIPNSGWYGFGWFSSNELASVVVASALLTLVVPILKGMQKRSVLP